MKISYSVKNLRRLKETPLIEMKPLTILVGRNSAGKSTFLRSLPLMRQSLETPSSAPILWSGHYVDYGDFKTAVSDKNEKNDIVFSFAISGISMNSSRMFGSRKEPTFGKKIDADEEIYISYFIGAYGDKVEEDKNSTYSTYLRKILLSIPERKMELEILFSSSDSEDNSMKIDGIDAFDLLKGYKVAKPESNLFARPVLIGEKDDDFMSDSTDIILSEFYQQFRKSKKPKPQGNRADDYRLDRFYRFDIRGMLSLKNLDLQNIKKLKSRSKSEEFQEICNMLIADSKSEFFNNIKTLHKLYLCFELFEILEDRFYLYFQNIAYIRPARAASERFYRKQELAISEISPDGQNLSILLDSLDQKQRDEFSKWVNSIFGYGVDVENDRGHISIVIKSQNKKNKEVNIADVGYGVSQILPVLAVIWWSIVQQEERYRYRRRFSIRFSGTKTVVIEQPELHLHPAHQAKLADALVNAIKKSNRNIKFVIETHSSDLINRLGELIEQEKEGISHKDVQVLKFSPEDDDDINSSTEVSRATFDKDGVLENWPYGFLHRD